MQINQTINNVLGTDAMIHSIAFVGYIIHRLVTILRVYKGYFRAVHLKDAKGCSVQS